MTSRYRAKQAVYLVTVPATFIPRSPWDFPDTFESGRLYEKNLAMFQAHGFARTYNKQAIAARAAGKWDRTWAILAKHLKARRNGEHPDARRARKGGAA